MTRLFTIGFTQKSAEQFFRLLTTAGVKQVVDTRLNNRSQLAGFSKVDDLPYFLRTISDIAYRHAPEMAPTQDMLDRYRKLKGSWAAYEEEFMALLARRNLVMSVSMEELSDSCLLCSEHEATRCHRRLVAEYLRGFYPDLQIVHLH
jgi:uncharacterized protein (DUF488 family)